jgi:uncharacterized protein YdbL (DUF1318 family)
MRRAALFLPLAFLVISCVTINVYFPAAAVEKAADKIVDDVWGGPGGPQDTGPGRASPPPREMKKGSGAEGRRGVLERLSSLGIGVAVAEAAGEANINISTPAIRALKDSIRTRAYALKPFMDRGNIGIGRDGLLVVRNRNGLNLREKAALARLVKSENRDRMALYREIARANNYTPDRVEDIKRVFARAWKNKAKKGWWVQRADGTWRKK